MKRPFRIFAAFALFSLAIPGHAQQALKTDTSGNPLSTLNLSGPNIVGLPASSAAWSSLTGTPPNVSLFPNNAGYVTAATAPVRSVNGQTGVVTLTLASTATAASHQFLTSYNASTGAFTLAQPAASDITGLAASATTDTTNASNITTGTLAYARQPVGTTVNTLAAGNDSRLATVVITAPDSTGTIDSSATFQAAFNAMPTTGGKIVVRAGVYSVTGPLTCANPVTIEGEGCGAIANNSGGGAAIGGGFMPGGTTIYTNTTTASAFVFNSSGCSFRDFALVNKTTGVPTAGTGFLVNKGHQDHWTRVIVDGFYDDIHIVSGFLWTIINCDIDDAVHAGLWIEDQAIYDGGDQSVADTNLTQGFFHTNYGNTAFGILHSSGGGAKIHHNKFNGNWNYAYVLALPDGVSTGVLELQGNSCEGMTGGAFKLGRVSGGTTGIYGRINISGNTIDLTLNGIESYAGIQDLCIGANYINVSNATLALYGGTGYKINSNTLSNGAAAPVTIQGIGGSLCDMLSQTWLGPVLINNATNDANIVKSDTRQVPTLSTTPVIIARYQLSAYRPVDTTLYVEGFVQNVGYFQYKLNRNYLFTSGTATITTNGTEYGPGAGQGGAAGQVALTVADNGSGLITISMTYSGTNVLTGTTTANVNGSVSSYYRN